MLAMIRHALDHDFIGFVPWKYPPSALMLLSPLAMLSLPAAHVTWAVVTIAAFLIVIYQIAGLAALIIAVAAPLNVPEIVMGQNAFATASVLGLSLLLCERRPLHAGLVAGLLSCKPQLFLLLPVMALFRGDWRQIAGMVISTGLLALGSAAAFGDQAWRAFFQSLHSNAAAFGEGAIPWSALQSLYALARSSGLSSAPAALLQATLSIGVMLVVARIDRQAPSNALRHAALCAGTILVTPFLLVWDLPIIGVGMAFLFAGLRQHRMSPAEAAALICLTGSTIVFFSLNIPVGGFDGLLLLLLVWRRCREAWSPLSTAGSLDPSPAVASTA